MTINISEFIGLFLLFGIPLLFVIKMIIDEIQSKREKAKPENQQYYYIQNVYPSSIPVNKDDEEFYAEHKEAIEKLVQDGLLSKRIASYVARVAIFGDRSHAHIKYTEQSLAIIQRALIDEYGVGAVFRYSYVLGLFQQLWILTPEEVNEYSKIMQNAIITKYGINSFKNG